MLYRSIALLSAAAATLFCALPAQAYVGPGAGLTMIGAIVGILVAILASIGVLLAWPIRALLRKRKQAKSGEVPADSVAQTASETAPAGETSPAAQAGPAEPPTAAEGEPTTAPR